MITMLLRVVGRQCARPMRRAVVLMAVTAVLEGALYALVAPVLHRLLGPEPAQTWPWMGGLAVGVAGFLVLRYLTDLSAMRVAASMMRGMYRRLGEHLAELPIGWYTGARVGDLSVTASRGLLSAMGAVVHLLGPFIAAIVTPLTVVVVIIALDWRLGLAMVLAGPVIAAIHHWAGRSAAAADAERHHRDRDATGRVIEYLQTQPELRAGGRTGERFGLLDDALRSLERSSRRSVFATLPSAVGLAVAAQAIVVALLVLGAYFALGGRIGVVEVLTVVVISVRCVDPLLNLSELGGQLRSARTELDRLDEVLRAQPLPQPQQPIAPSGHAIELMGVTVRRNDHTILDGVSLTVPEGQRLAIVGRRGRARAQCCRCSHGSLTSPPGRCGLAALMSVTSTPRS